MFIVKTASGTIRYKDGEWEAVDTNGNRNTDIEKMCGMIAVAQNISPSDPSPEHTMAEAVARTFGGRVETVTPPQVSSGDTIH